MMENNRKHQQQYMLRSKADSKTYLKFIKHTYKHTHAKIYTRQ